MGGGGHRDIVGRTTPVPAHTSANTINISEKGRSVEGTPGQNPMAQYQDEGYQEEVETNLSQKSEHEVEHAVDDGAVTGEDTSESRSEPNKDDAAGDDDELTQAEKERGKGRWKLQYIPPDDD